MVILEGMASGMPVVAVRSSGIDDIIENGINGFKTPPDAGQWCARINQLMNDPDLYDRLSANAKSTAANYSIIRFGYNIQRFYADILTARHSSADLQ
jgi:glycosyltransferase involved in cell wall biosynthesis